MDEKGLIRNEEVPPSYEEASASGPGTVVTGTNIVPNASTPFQNSINCQVCRHMINLDQKMNNLVVKCNNCGEATPIKAAPPGKKYVRCTCNGLLICKSSSSRVGCPRPHCRAIINLTPAIDSQGVATGVSSNVGLLSLTLRVICAICGSPFIVNRSRKSNILAAKCPHCHSVSSIGPEYARFRWLLFITLGFLLLIIGIAVTVTTYEIALIRGGYYVIYVGVLLSGIVLIIRGSVYCCMPVSVIEAQPGSNHV